MKKLMIALGAVALAFGVQAASVNWAIDGSDKEFGALYTSIYKTAAANITAILDANQPADLGTALAGYTDLNAAALKRGAGGGELTGMSEGDVLTFIVYDAKTIAGSANYYVYEATVTDDMLYEGTQSPASKIDLTGASFGSSKAIGGGSIPEPTSGLLLLLGVAGLALRRRRA